MKINQTTSSSFVNTGIKKEMTEQEFSSKDVFQKTEKEENLGIYRGNKAVKSSSSPGEDLAMDLVTSSCQ